MKGYLVNMLIFHQNVNVSVHQVKLSYIMNIPFLLCHKHSLLPEICFLCYDTLLTLQVYCTLPSGVIWT